jgi:hypothetical protein
MDRDGEDASTTWIRMGRMKAPHMDRDGEDDSNTYG